MMCGKAGREYVVAEGLHVYGLSSLLLQHLTGDICIISPTTEIKLNNHGIIHRQALFQSHQLSRF